MLSYFIISVLCQTYSSLSLDDTYHSVTLTEGEDTTFWIQPQPKHSAILLVHNCSAAIKCFIKGVVSNGFTELKPSDVIDRDKNLHYVQEQYIFTNDDPSLLKLTTTQGKCTLMINHVHTDLVYRSSMVLGTLSIFICLFLFVFSWSIFCGACRATPRR